MENPRYIVVEGTIGVGKTSLAKKLADAFGADLMLEMADDNPFLKGFYNNHSGSAFQTQLFFLLQRAEQIRNIQKGDLFCVPRVADFLFDKDMLFAELNLSESELLLYKKIYRELNLDIPHPDLVIYLQAPVNILQKRISLRGIDYEQDISSKYLSDLNDAYASYFHHYDKTPLLIINASEIDFVNNEADFKLLLEQIQQINKGRHYFNPSIPSTPDIELLT